MALRLSLVHCNFKKEKKKVSHYYKRKKKRKEKKAGLFYLAVEVNATESLDTLVVLFSWVTTLLF